MGGMKIIARAMSQTSYAGRKSNQYDTVNSQHMVKGLNHLESNYIVYYYYYMKLWFFTAC
jgi:hypothetical protein